MYSYCIGLGVVAALRRVGEIARAKDGLGRRKCAEWRSCPALQPSLIILIRGARQSIAGLVYFPSFTAISPSVRRLLRFCT